MNDSRRTSEGRLSSRAALRALLSRTLIDLFHDLTGSLAVAVVIARHRHGAAAAPRHPAGTIIAALIGLARAIRRS
jgi:hypothetical protein